MAERFGQPLMPWQRLVADVGGELVEDPDTGLLIPAYREVVFTVPRQSGKTTLVLAWECQRASGWEHLGPQRIAYSAQTGQDASKKLLEDQKPVIDPHKRALGIRRFYEAKGSEGVVWTNGSRLVLLANTEAAGHGKTVDLGVKDELFADYDDRRDQALIPAMATRPAGQVLACSTMGTEESIPWNALVERGRLAVGSGVRTGIAYFEWSADDDDDPDDPETWFRCMPALGRTISEAVVVQARSQLKDGEFRRAFTNRKTRSDERVLPVREWDATCSDTAAPDPIAAFAIDINPERSASSITAASTVAAELVQKAPGTGWVVERAAEIDAKAGGKVWALEAAGPAASLIQPLKDKGLRVYPLSPREYMNACSDLYDGVMGERPLRIRRHPDLDSAAAGAAKRQVGDDFAWARRSASADITPLVGVTCALWAAGLPEEASEPWFDFG